MGINPIRIMGNWDEGYALDIHTIKSTPIGQDMYGHMKYDTERSEMGELLYGFKYKGIYDNLQGILNLAKPFLDKWEALKTVDIVLPVPASKERDYQPAVEIAKSIAAYLNVSYTDEVLRKITEKQSKDMDRDKKEMRGAIIAVKKVKKPHTVLLVDDLYSTGETLKECVRVLKQDKKIGRIYVLTMTKTR